MTEREAVIRECIEYLRARPGRKAVQTLEGMLRNEQPKAPAVEHPWRKTIKEPTCRSAP